MTHLRGMFTAQCDLITLALNSKALVSIICQIAIPLWRYDIVIWEVEKCKCALTGSDAYANHWKSAITNSSKIR
jgi:hypothetical protein